MFGLGTESFEIGATILEIRATKPELSEDGGGDFIAIARAQSVGGDV